MSRTAKLLALLTLSCLAASLTACGGSSGGGGTPSVTYSGSTSAAVITPDNAGTLALDSFDGIETASTVNVLSVQGVADSDRSRLPSATAVGTTVKDLFLQADLNATNPTRAVTPETIPGPCGGSATVSPTGETSATIAFNSYCEEGIILDGTVSISFNADLTSLTITYGAFTAGNASESFTAGGSITFERGATNDTMTINMVMLDNGTGATYWLKNYRVETDGITMTISGTYYDPVHGFVVISTIKTLLLGVGDWPDSGILRYAGGGNTWVEIDFGINPGLATGSADTTGDGTADFLFTYDPATDTVTPTP